MSSIAETRIRNAMLDRLHPHHTENRRVIEELGLRNGKVRADIAVIDNKWISLYEIKSERDNLLRLPDQIEIYNEVASFCFLVVHRSHLAHAMVLLPEWWGVVAVDYDRVGGGDMLSGMTMGQKRELQFTVVRPPKPNPTVKPRVVAQLLWREEVWSVLRDSGLGKGHSGSSRQVMWTLLAKKMPVEELTYNVRRKLIERKEWRQETYKKPPKRRRRRRRKKKAKPKE